LDPDDVIKLDVEAKEVICFADPSWALSRGDVCDEEEGEDDEDAVGDDRERPEALGLF